MKKQLTYITPLRAGIVLGALYACLALIIVPFLLIGTFLASRGAASSIIAGIFLAVFAPVLYAGLGFIAGVIMAALYNLIARWTGGIEFEVRDVAPSSD